LFSWVLDVSRFFTGSPTDKTIWLLVVGIIAIIIGLAGLLRGQHKVALRLRLKNICNIKKYCMTPKFI